MNRKVPRGVKVVEVSTFLSLRLEMSDHTEGIINRWA